MAGKKKQSGSASVLSLGFGEALGAYFTDPKTKVIYRVKSAPFPVWRRFVKSSLAEVPGQLLEDNLLEVLRGTDDQFSRFYVADCLFGASPAFRRRLSLNAPPGPEGVA